MGLPGGSAMGGVEAVERVMDSLISNIAARSAICTSRGHHRQIWPCKQVRTCSHGLSRRPTSATLDSLCTKRLPRALSTASWVADYGRGGLGAAIGWGGREAGGAPPV